MRNVNPPPLPHRLADLLQCWHQPEYDCYDADEILEQAEHLCERERIEEAVRDARRTLDDCRAVIEATLRTDVSARLDCLAKVVVPAMKPDHRLNQAISAVFVAKRRLLDAIGDLREQFGIAR